MLNKGRVDPETLPETVAWRCFVFWKKIQRKTSVPEACKFIKKDALAQVFSCEFCKGFESTSFYRAPLVGALFKILHKYSV